ncbi:hypothetical protein BDZ89DRAFT_1163845 [Hymenopellis radicata]|nr:hypothetical protein BDZ89DRAFT_1163845 [Hymenopellis radicata]
MDMNTSPRPHTHRAGWRTELCDDGSAIVVYPGNLGPPPHAYVGPLNPRDFRDHLQYRQFRYLPPNFAYLALIGNPVPFYDGLFYCLAYSPFELPINYTPGKGYHLNDAVQRSWANTFSVIRRTANYLGSLSKSNIPAQRPWTRPEEYGYTLCHKTRELARQAAFSAQQSFIPWVAYTTFYVGVIEFEVEKEIAKHDWWRYTLRKKMQFDEAWGVAMEASSIFDHGRERLGGYFKIGGDKRTEVSQEELVMLEVLRSFKAPIYLDWGSARKLNDIVGLVDELYDPQTRPDPPYVHMRPSRRDIKILLVAQSIKGEDQRDQSQSDPDLQNGTENPRLAADEEPLLLALPDESDAARPEDSLPPGVEAQLTKNGRVVFVDTVTNTTTSDCPPSTAVPATLPTANVESPQEFFKRRADENAKAEEKEDALQRQRRLGKESAAHKTVIKNASFFLWTERSGVWVREELDREDGEQTFMEDDFTTAQTVYDGFSNTYDFCRALDATGVSLGMLRDEETAEEVYGAAEPMVVDTGTLEPRAFWAQRAAEYPALEAREAPDERVRRHDRESAGESTKRPDSNASAFMWEMRGPDGALHEQLPCAYSEERTNMHWVRRRLNADEVDACFNAAQSTQVRFDPYRNEWDVSWAFDPTCVARGVYQVYRPHLDDTFAVSTTPIEIPDHHHDADVDVCMEADAPSQTELSDERLDPVPFCNEGKVLHDLDWGTSKYLDLPHVNGPVNAQGLLRELFENFGLSVGAEDAAEDENSVVIEAKPLKGLRSLQPLRRGL